MSNNALHDILDSLHKQLASLPALTTQNIEDLKAIAAEIQATLEKPVSYTHLRAHET